MFQVRQSEEIIELRDVRIKLKQQSDFVKFRPRKQPKKAPRVIVRGTHVLSSIHSPRGNN
jgi:hypothetical protein